MANEFLSQEEVDALLFNMNGLSSDKSEEETELLAIDSSIPQKYNLGTQERIIRGKMPTLEIIHKRFIRLIRGGIFNFVRKNPDITDLGIKVTKYSEFIRNTIVPTNLNLCTLKPLRGNCLFIIEPQLIFTLINSLYGGDVNNATRVEGREFSTLEQRIINRFLDTIFTEFKKSWEAIYPINPEFVRSEMHTQFANIANQSDAVVVMGIRVEIGEKSIGGTIQICIPYASLESIRDILYSTMQGDQAEPDKRWMNTMSESIYNTKVTIKTNLAKTTLSISDIASLKVGDVIPLEIPEIVIATINNVPAFSAKFGSLNEKNALKVEEMMLRN